MEFNIEDVVYLKTDTEINPRIITRYTVAKQGITYALVCGTIESWHYDFEITKDIETIKKQKVVGLGK